MFKVLDSMSQSQYCLLVWLNKAIISHLVFLSALTKGAKNVWSSFICAMPSKTIVLLPCMVSFTNHFFKKWAGPNSTKKKACSLEYAKARKKFEICKILKTGHTIEVKLIVRKQHFELPGVCPENLLRWAGHIASLLQLPKDAASIPSRGSRFSDGGKKQRHPCVEISVFEFTAVSSWWGSTVL